jgi:hypothetical protein
MLKNISGKSKGGRHVGKILIRAAYAMRKTCANKKPASLTGLAGV